LAAAHERFTTVLDELDAAVSVTAASLDPRFAGQRQVPQELLFANQYYRRLFGENTRGHEQLSRRPGMAYQTQSIRQAQGNKTITIYEIHDTQINRWFEVRQRAIQWVDGRTASIQIATDITSRKEAEEMTRQQQEKLQLTSRLTTMGEMASSLAHELNQPLTAIANYSMGVYNRVRDGKMEQPDLLAALEKTSQQAERAGKIIRRIREFVKRSEPNRRACDIQTIVDNAVSFADIEAKKKSVSIRVSLPASMPMVQADPILIEQVLLNLLKNGVEAMQQSLRRELELRVELEEEMVKFIVQDHGTGIAPDHLNKLFEPFFSTKAEGMGMGLNICRSIIEFHHGRLWVDSQLGQGSTFYFTLPR
jgi:C4-dicarboxylate-specific signal transduction histidine kinase